MCCKTNSTVDLDLLITTMIRFFAFKSSDKKQLLILFEELMMPTQ